MGISKADRLGKDARTGEWKNNTMNTNKETGCCNKCRDPIKKSDSYRCDNVNCPCYKETECCEKCSTKVNNYTPSGEVFQYAWNCINSQCPCHTETDVGVEEMVERLNHQLHILEEEGAGDYDLAKQDLIRQALTTFSEKIRKEERNWIIEKYGHYLDESELGSPSLRETLSN